MRSGATRREGHRSIRRKMIIEIATAMFLKQGYAATTMSDVASKLGGSKGTLWSHFRSKEELFTVVVEESYHAFRSEIEHCLRADPVNNLHVFADKFVSKITSYNSILLHRLLASEASHFPQFEQIFVDMAVSPAQRILIKFFTEEMAIGRMRQADPGQAALELISMLQRPMLIMIWNAEQMMDNQQRDHYTSCAIDTFLRAYLPSRV
jgi:TetR/AcrR family transcriptional repressor of mexJK operon